MIQVEINRDIKDYDPKLIGPFTARQLIAVLIGLAYSVPIGLLLPIDSLPIKLAIIGVLAAPAIICGWASIFDMPIPTFLKMVWQTMIAQPAKRKYETESPYLETEDTEKIEKVKPSPNWKARG